MNINHLLLVSEMVIKKEHEKFERRITKVLNELMPELKAINVNVAAKHLSHMARDRFEEQYPKAPFFLSVFDRVRKEYERRLVNK